MEAYFGQALLVGLEQRLAQVLLLLFGERRGVEGQYLLLLGLEHATHLGKAEYLAGLLLLLGEALDALAALLAEHGELLAHRVLHELHLRLELVMVRVHGVAVLLDRVVRLERLLGVERQLGLERVDVVRERLYLAHLHVDLLGRLLVLLLELGELPLAVLVHLRVVLHRLLELIERLVDLELEVDAQLLLLLHVAVARLVALRQELDVGLVLLVEERLLHGEYHRRQLVHLGLVARQYVLALLVELDLDLGHEVLALEAGRVQLLFVQLDELVDVLEVRAHGHGVLFVGLLQVLDERAYDGVLAVDDALERLAHDLDVLEELFGLGVAHYRAPLVVDLVEVVARVLLLLLELLLEQLVDQVLLLLLRLHLQQHLLLHEEHALLVRHVLHLARRLGHSFSSSSSCILIISVTCDSLSLVRI